MASLPDVRVISISDIRENPVALRTVNLESEEYIGLRDSIRLDGILNPISVREQTEDVDGKIISYFELVDGLHRYTAAKEAGVKKIPVLVVDLDNTRTLEAQVMANVHKVETRPIEYTRLLQRVFASNPTLTLTDMASKVAKSASWVGQRLNLLKLETSIQVLVNDGKIAVSNAVQLAKLPPQEQLNFIDNAMRMNAEEFVPLVQIRVKELKDAARQGRDPKPTEFVPLPRVQKMSVLKSEFETPAIGPELCKKCKVKKPEEGFALAIAFVLSLDPTSVEIRKAMDDEKKAKLADEKKKRAADRAQKKADEAAKAAAKAIEEAKS